MSADSKAIDSKLCYTLFPSLVIKMRLSSAIVAFGLTCAQIITSKIIHSRQEACNSAENSAAYSACAMQAAFGGSSIIPKLIPTFLPKAALSVTYGNVVIGGAQQLSPARVFAAPFLSLSFISNGSRAFQQPYVIIGLDYQPQGSGMSLFWLQSDVTIDENTGVMSSSIPPIVPYVSPNPAPGTGTHEFIFFVFVDPGLLALYQQNPQIVLLNSVATFQTFLSGAKLNNQLVAGSYFKSTYDGAVINGQTPAALDAQRSQKTPVSPQSSGFSTAKVVTSAKQSVDQIVRTAPPAPAQMPASPSISGKDNAPVQAIGTQPSTVSGGLKQASNTSGSSGSSATNQTISGTKTSAATTNGNNSDEDQSTSSASLLTQNRLSALMSILLAAIFEL